MVLFRPIREKIRPNTGLHILGFAKADDITEFARHNITSFDTTSPLLRAFKDSKVNYFLPGSNGKLRYYMAIRIPQALENLTLKRLVKYGRVSQEKLVDLERNALATVRAYDRNEVGLEQTLDTTTKYAEILLTEPDPDARPVSGVRLEMVEVKKENEMWREAEIVTKATQLGLSPMASTLGAGTWIARCPGTNHTIQMQPRRNLFYCGYCRVKGGIDELDEFAAQRKGYSWRKNSN